MSFFYYSNVKYLVPGLKNRFISWPLEDWFKWTFNYTDVYLFKSNELLCPENSTSVAISTPSQLKMNEIKKSRRECDYFVVIHKMEQSD